MMEKIKQISEGNPANTPGKDEAERKRVPMSVPMRKLEAPEIPGYHCHWMRGTKARIAQAARAGYEFVSEDELAAAGGLNSMDLGGFGIATGSDMGTRVSLVSGEEFGPDGQAERLYLMKLKEGWWRESQAVSEERNEQVAASIRGGRFRAQEDKTPGDLSYGGPEGPVLTGIKVPNTPRSLFEKKS
jgi:hypothetical protein